MASTKLSVRTTDLGVAQAISNALEAAEPALDAVTLFEDGAGAWRIEAYSQGRADAEAAAAALRGRSRQADRQHRARRPARPQLGGDLAGRPAAGHRRPLRRARQPRPRAHSLRPARHPGRRRRSLRHGPSRHDARLPARHRQAGAQRAPSRRVLDLGCGSGVLAIAAARAMRAAQVIATDSDPIAVEVARANADANGARRIATACALGLDHPWLRHAAPFDLIIANILAGPLRVLAGDVSKSATPRRQRRAVGHPQPGGGGRDRRLRRPRLRRRPAPPHRRMVDADAAQAALSRSSCAGRRCGNRANCRRHRQRA